MQHNFTDAIIIFLTKFPVWQSAAIVAAAVAVVATTIWYLATVRAGAGARGAFKKLNASLGSGLIAGFMLYATLLANSVWREFNEAKSVINEEARAIRDTMRHSREIGGELGQELISEMRFYVKSVADSEWPAMEHESESYTASVTLQHLRLLAQFKVTGEHERRAHERLAAALDRAAAARSRRLSIARENIASVIWMTLIMNALVVMAFGAMVHSEDRRTAAIMLACYSVMIACAIEVLIVYDRPFVGVTSIGPDMLLMAAEFKEPRKL